MTQYNVPGWTIPTTAAVWQGWKGVNTVAFWVFVVVMTGCTASFVGKVGESMKKQSEYMSDVYSNLNRCVLAQRQRYGREDRESCRLWAFDVTPKPE